MADIPSLSSGSVGSRFVSQIDLEKAKETRDEQWKAAYARLGQEPPPRPEEDADYDGRSLYEKLQSQKTAKQEEWEEKTKLSNQFRALEEDEVLFLDSMLEEKRKEEMKRKDADGEEVKSFLEAVAARNRLPSDTPAPPPTKPAVAQAKEPPKPKPTLGKKDQKSLLKGVVVKKKSTATVKKNSESAGVVKEVGGKKREAGDGGATTAEVTKKQKLS